MIILIAAVSFSIKAKENETGGLEKRSAFRHEDSDDGSDGEPEYSLYD